MGNYVSTKDNGVMAGTTLAVRLELENKFKKVTKTAEGRARLRLVAEHEAQLLYQWGCFNYEG